MKRMTCRRTSLVLYTEFWRIKIVYCIFKLVFIFLINLLRHPYSFDVGQICAKQQPLDSLLWRLRCVAIFWKKKNNNNITINQKRIKETRQDQFEMQLLTRARRRGPTRLQSMTNWGFCTGHLYVLCLITHDQPGYFLDPPGLYMSVYMVTFLDPSVFDWQSISTSSRSYASCPLKALPY